MKSRANDRKPLGEFVSQSCRWFSSIGVGRSCHQYGIPISCRIVSVLKVVEHRHRPGIVVHGEDGSLKGEASAETRGEGGDGGFGFHGGIVVEQGEKGSAISGRASGLGQRG